MRVAGGKGIFDTENQWLGITFAKLCSFSSCPGQQPSPLRVQTQRVSASFLRVPYVKEKDLGRKCVGKCGCEYVVMSLIKSDKINPSSCAHVPIHR